MITTKTTHATPTDNIVRAVLTGASAFFCFSVMSVFAKLLSETHHVIEIAFWRNLLPILPIMLWLYFTNQTDKFVMKKPGLTVLRSIIGVTSLAVMFAAYARLPMADATVLLMASVLITPALSFFFLKEHVGMHRWLAILIGFIGVAIMAGPSGQISFWGTVFALSSATFHAILAVILRQMKDQPAITTTFYFMVFGAAAVAIFMPFIAKPFNHSDILYILACSAAGLCGQILLSRAYGSAPTYIVMPLNYLGIVWASMFDILIWSIIPGWPVFAGASIIFAANSYILYRERLHKKEKYMNEQTSG